MDIKLHIYNVVKIVLVEESVVVGSTPGWPHHPRVNSMGYSTKNIILSIERAINLELIKL